MTRILLRPAELPRYPQQAHQLHGEWAWWQLRLPPGDEPIQAWDPDRDNIREASVTFNRERDPDTTLLNPPVMRLIHTDRVSANATGFAMLMTGRRIDCFIVWWGSPGPGWIMLPGNTCRPGDYRMDHIVEYEGEPRTRSQGEVDLRDMHELRYFSGQHLLDWPHTVDFTETQRLTREEIAAAFGVPVEYLSPNRIRQLEGLQPIYDGPATVQPISQAEPPQFPRVYGLVGADAFRRCDQCQRHLGVGSTFVVAAIEIAGQLLCEECHEMRRNTGCYDGPLDDTVVAFQRYADPARLRDPLPSVIRPWPPQSRNPNVLPESEVIAEIDRLEDYFDTRDEAEAAVRLVNDQVRGGPRDDYNDDRYDKCNDCGHDWHGLECGKGYCGCLNTDWLKHAGR
jgi:hypothetical protein